MFGAIPIVASLFWGLACYGPVEEDQEIKCGTWHLAGATPILAPQVETRSEIIRQTLSFIWWVWFSEGHRFCYRGCSCRKPWTLPSSAELLIRYNDPDALNLAKPTKLGGQWSRVEVGNYFQVNFHGKCNTLRPTWDFYPSALTLNLTLTSKPLTLILPVQ